MIYNVFFIILKIILHDFPIIDVLASKAGAQDGLFCLHFNDLNLRRSVIVNFHIHLFNGDTIAFWAHYPPQHIKPDTNSPFD